MTKREINLKIFQKQSYPGVFFQPRLEPWVMWHEQFGKTPARYRDWSLRDFFDRMDMSIRYVHYHTGMPDPVKMEFSKDVKFRVDERGDKRGIVVSTPYGDMYEEQKFTIDKTWRTIRFYGKTREDLPRLKWLFANARYSFSPENFRKGSEFVGDRGEPQFWVPKSPYQSLAQSWFGFEDFIVTLAEYPDEVEEVMKEIDAAYDGLYRELCAFPDVHIVNFGENIHSSLFSPRYIDKYYMPFYEKRVGQLRKAGKFSHIHWDGYVKPVQKYLKLFPFDGIEALTPLPQGDITIEELKENMGDKVLLDGIPAVLFLPTFSKDELAECVEKVVRLFHPNLVLGISDELPEGSGEESMERVRWVSEMAKKMKA